MLYTVHYFKEIHTNNFPLKLEFVLFYSHVEHLDVTGTRVINYCFTFPNLFTCPFLWIPALNTLQIRSPDANGNITYKNSS